MDKNLEQDMVRFRRYREAMLDADGAELEHHLAEFVREVDRNELLAPTLAALPTFDANKWWDEVTKGAPFGLSALKLPDDEGERLVVLLDLARSMASGDPKQVSIDGFGRVFRKGKRSEAVSVATSVILRPLADSLTDKLRERALIANPAIRELAGVPLDRVPADGEGLVFLSHTSVDKPTVRPYFELLRELGFSPWLDEHDMKAGDTIHRAIADGFDKSCAVIFFITQNFKDERWLQREIDHAVNRKIEKGDRFAVVTLVFDQAEVPRPLRDYLWVNVKNQVSAFREVIRALPLEVGATRWRK